MYLCIYLCIGQSQQRFWDTENKCNRIYLIYYIVRFWNGKTSTETNFNSIQHTAHKYSVLPVDILSGTATGHYRFSVVCGHYV